MIENNNDKYLNLFEKIRYFSKTREAKEVLAFHFAIVTLCSIIYVVSNLLVTAVFLAVAFTLEMLVFHVIWIYRDNKEKESPFKYAVIKELKISVTALTSVALFILINNFIYNLTGISILIPVTVLCSLLFFGASIYKVYRTRVTEGDVSELGLG